MNNMEKAIIINRIEDFKYWNRKYSRIYLGNEFCPRLLPRGKELDDIIKIIKKEKLKLTLLTGQVDSQGLRLMKKMFLYLTKGRILDEIAINDYGMFGYTLRKFPAIKIILGRMLSRSIILDENSYFYKTGLRRVEYDNLSEIQKIKSGNISYYYPYSFFYNSRYCPVADLGHNKLKNHGIIECFKECLRIGELKVNSSILAQPTILKGNAQFIKNKTDFRSLINFKINRLIFQPHVPV